MRTTSINRYSIALRWRRATTVVVALLAARAAFAFDITQCGQVVPAGETGIVQNDLTCARAGGFCGYCLLRPRGCATQFDQPCTTREDCPGPPRGIAINTECNLSAVYLGPDATLDLNGHSVIGAFIDGPDGAVLDPPTRGVWGSSGVIRGPGGIGNFERQCIDTFDRPGEFEVSDLSVRDCGSAIYGQRLGLTNVTVTRARQYGIYADTLDAHGVTVTQSGSNGVVVNYRLRATNLTATHNMGSGIQAGRAVVRGLTAVKNRGAGLYSYAGATVIDSTLTRNRDSGLRSVRGATLIDSTLTDNGFFRSGPDVITGRRPRLRRTTCDQSAGSPEGTWGVCLND